MICLGNVRLVKNLTCRKGLAASLQCRGAFRYTMLYLSSHFMLANSPTTIRCYITVDWISLHLFVCGGMRYVKNPSHILENQIPSLDWLPDHSEKGHLVGFRNEGYRSNEMSSLSTLHWERNSGCLSGCIFRRLSHGIQLNAVHNWIESQYRVTHHVFQNLPLT